MFKPNGVIWFTNPKSSFGIVYGQTDPGSEKKAYISNIDGEDVHADALFIQDHGTKILSEHVRELYEFFFPPKYQRSGRQNRYYHGVVLRTFGNSEIGYTEQEWHEILKHKFLKEWRTVKGKTKTEEIEITKSTTDLNTKEFEEFMTKVRQWASIELGIWIPEPNEPPTQE